MLLFAIKGVEDGVMQVFQRLITPDLNRAREHRIFLRKLFRDRPADNTNVKRVNPILAQSRLAGWTPGSFFFDVDLRLAFTRFSFRSQALNRPVNLESGIDSRSKIMYQALS